MNCKLSLVTVLAAGFLPLAAVSQVSPTVPASPSETPAAAAPQAPPPPSAFPAKIALIAFEQAVFATNEGQRAVADINNKYAPKKTEFGSQENEINSLRKQLEAAPTLSDEERQSRLKTIDNKEKKLSLDEDEAQTSYQTDLQKAYAVVAAKVDLVMKKYVADNGYTILLDVGGQQSSVMWAVATPNSDISLAVITAYNASSGVTAPAPSAPSAARPKPATPRPAPATAPKK